MANLSNNSNVKKGWLNKRSVWLKDWRMRYCECDDDNLTFSVDEYTYPHITIILSAIIDVKEVAGERNHMFVVVTPNEVFTLSADNEDEKNFWLTHLRKALKRDDTVLVQPDSSARMLKSAKLSTISRQASPQQSATDGAFNSPSSKPKVAAGTSTQTSYSSRSKPSTPLDIGQSGPVIASRTNMLSSPLMSGPLSPQKQSPPSPQLLPQGTTASPVKLSKRGVDIRYSDHGESRTGTIVSTTVDASNSVVVDSAAGEIDAGFPRLRALARRSQSSPFRRLLSWTVLPPAYLRCLCREVWQQLVLANDTFDSKAGATSQYHDNSGSSNNVQSSNAGPTIDGVRSRERVSSSSSTFDLASGRLAVAEMHVAVILLFARLPWYGPHALPRHMVPPPSKGLVQHLLLSQLGFDSLQTFEFEDFVAFVELLVPASPFVGDSVITLVFRALFLAGCLPAVVSSLFEIVCPVSPSFCPAQTPSVGLVISIVLFYSLLAGLATPYAYLLIQYSRRFIYSMRKISSSRKSK